MASNGSTLGSLGVAPPPRIADMEAYDALPPEFRELFRSAPIPMTAINAGPAIERMGRQTAARIFRETLERDLPKMIAAAWGPDHPALKT